MQADPKLSNMLECLSEDTLYSLKRLLENRARRGALKAQKGKAPDDLQPLRVLLTAVEHRHDMLLLVDSEDEPDG